MGESVDEIMAHAASLGIDLKRFIHKEPSRSRISSSGLSKQEQKQRKKKNNQQRKSRKKNRRK